MSDNTPWPVFNGELDCLIQPNPFLRQFRLRTALLTDAQRLKVFADCLGEEDSTAATWFTGLAPDAKNSWDAVEVLFVARFPSLEKAKKTKMEYERELEELRLEPGRIGKKELVGGQDTWSHIAFSHQALTLAAKAGLAQSSTYIYKIRDNLPKTVKNRLPIDDDTTWTTFCTALRAVPINILTDYATEHAMEEAKEKSIYNRLAKLEASSTQQVPDSPTRALRTGLEAVTISKPKQNRNAGARNPKPPFTERLLAAATAISNEEKEKLQARTTEWVHHPNTEAGKLAYKQQIKLWGEKYGTNTQVSIITPFPLFPGTSPVCSREHFRCGMSTQHDWRVCTHPAINRKEADWRRICNQHLKEIAPQVNAVLADSDDEEDAWVYRRGVDVYEQGKD